MNHNTTTLSQRLVIISNRLPVVISKADDGSYKIDPGSGGLVTAIAPVLRHRGGLWIGWPGLTEGIPEEEVKSLLESANESAGFKLEPVILSKEEVDLFYHGFANEIIWPLFHDLLSLCHFTPAYWNGYKAVSYKFAETVMKQLHSNDFLWVHDYQLLHLAADLRTLGCDAFLSFFLHIPFPPLDIFLKLPWRFQILRAMLEYDFIGFQTARDRRNFTQCVKALIPEAKHTSTRYKHIFKIGQREVGVVALPISIDFNEFSKLASAQKVSDRAWLLHEGIPNQQIVFSLDRLDHTKGIPNRLEAIGNLLQRYPNLHQRITFIQIVVPSRVDIPKYQSLKHEIDQLVSEINSKFTTESWVPIHYMYKSVNRVELLSHYRSCEIALITPIKDGMNLVAKEYIASNEDKNGVLILSEFAGAAAQLHNDALLVNPYDIEGTANAIYQAYHMPMQERQKRMARMQRNIHVYDIYWWVSSFLKLSFSKDLIEFTQVQEYFPVE